MYEKITLLKLGGSLITDKEVARTLKVATVQRVLKEIDTAVREHDLSLVLGHGQGSFAHIPAAKYQTKQGFIHQDSRLGMVLTSQAVGMIHGRMIDLAIEAGLPVFSYKMSSAVCTRDTEKKLWNSQTLEILLKYGLIPLTTGDVLADESNGCSIWSTDTIFSHIAQELDGHQDFQIETVIHASDVDGVLDSSGAVIPTITPENFAQFESAIGQAKGVDVTGGMLHKVKEALHLAKKYSIQTHIINGNREGCVQRALSGEQVGTLISAHDFQERSY